MFDRPEGGNRALLVALDLPGSGGEPAREEFRGLAAATGAEIVGELSGARRQPDPRYFIGSGKSQELAEFVTACDADLVIVNHDLSPAQERNIEALVKARVLDRSGMILDIFARRARTHEGKLQVELAQLKHLATRLVRGWSHLERQKGGIGLRGPGESQLEMDRRLIAGRMRQVERRIEHVRGSRALNRRRRRRQEVPLVALVGYTNAGKSTLFEKLTGNQTYVADQLFATLDTTLRQLPLPAQEAAVLADTVGFVRDLPHSLVTAFRATLEEAAEASLLVHVLDAADTEREVQRAAVEAVLEEIGAQDVPRLEVCNKIDQIEDAQPRVDRDENGRPSRVWLSAATGDGLELLPEAIGRCLSPEQDDWEVCLPPSQGRLRAEFFRLDAVRDETVLEDGEIRMHLRLEPQKLDRLLRSAGLAPTVARRWRDGIRVAMQG